MCIFLHKKLYIYSVKYVTLDSAPLKIHLVYSKRSILFFGGGERNRTDDLMLAKHALSQLSYTPKERNKK